MAIGQLAPPAADNNTRGCHANPPPPPKGMEETNPLPTGSHDWDGVPAACCISVSGRKSIHAANCQETSEHLGPSRTPLTWEALIGLFLLSYAVHPPRTVAPLSLHTAQARSLSRNDPEQRRNVAARAQIHLQP